MRPDRDHRPLVRRPALLLVACALSVVVASCAAGPPPFEPPRVAIDHPSFAPTFEAYATAPIRRGNRVDVLLNGEEIFPAQLHAIRAARVSSTYAQYLFETAPCARSHQGHE